VLTELVEVPYGPSEATVVLPSPSTQASKFMFWYHPEYAVVHPGRLDSGLNVRV
jgi:hypothetical protein